MKVLFINTFFSVGGPPRVVEGVYRTIEEHGDECLLAAARRDPLPGMKAYRIGKAYDTYLAGMKTRIFDGEGLACKEATRRLIHRIEEFAPDVINLHNLHGYYVNYPMLFEYLKQSGVPVVWTLHDCWAFTGHCAYIPREGCDQWKSCCGETSRCLGKSTYPASMGLSRAYRNFQQKQESFLGMPNMTLVAPSQWLGGMVRDSFLSGYGVEVIPNGIDLDVFSLGDNAVGLERPGKRTILGVSHGWEERKGLVDFIELARILGDGYEVVMVGLTDDQVKSLPGQVRGIGATSNVDELVEIYRSADVLVNCTYQDNFPTVNIEALACGTPVLTYDTGGSPEAIDETCGIVVAQGDIEAMAVSVRRAVADPFDPVACRRRAKLFDRRARFADYRALFARVVGKSVREVS